MAIYSEKYHEVRIARLGKGGHAHPAVRSWTGDEIGWWEGDTLVVETTNFAAASLARYRRLRISADVTVTQRFTRTSPQGLMYEFSVSDPDLYTQSWRAESRSPRATPAFSKTPVTRETTAWPASLRAPEKRSAARGKTATRASCGGIRPHGATSPLAAKDRSCRQTPTGAGIQAGRHPQGVG